MSAQLVALAIRAGAQAPFGGLARVGLLSLSIVSFTAGVIIVWSSARWRK